MASGEQSAIRPAVTALRASSLGYGFLLGLILVSLAFQLAAPDERWSRLVTVVLQSVTLLLALRISGVRALVTRLATVIVTLALLGATGVLVGVGELREESARSVALMLAALAPAAIAVGVVREIRTSTRVTIRAMFGVLCIYLLLGALFAFSYGVVAAFQDMRFFAEADAETQSNFLYFSFATQTTTGYGDLTAATGIGRSLAITQALVGQIYLVTVVALIVSNLGRPRGRPAT